MPENIKILRGGNKQFHYTYQTKNLINGKTYIGVHSTNKLNDGYLGSGDRILNSINKYGKHNFAIQILDFFDKRDDAFEEEKFLVTKEWVESRDNYNVTLGGFAPPSSLGRKKSAETIAKTKISRIGFRHSDEAKRKISEAGKGRPKSEETLIKMSSSMKGKNTYPKSKEHIEKIVASRKKNYRPMSIEARERIRLAMIKRFEPNRIANEIKEQERVKKRIERQVRSAKLRDDKIAKKLAWLQGDRKQSAETIEKKRQSLIGKKRTPEQRERMRESKKHSEETKRKMSIRSSNISDETRKKLSLASKGRKHSEESIAKMRIAQQKPPMTEEAKQKLRYIHLNLSQEKRDRQNAGRHSFHVSAFNIKTDEKIGDFISINKCAKFLGISPTTINRYLSGKSKTPLSYYFKIIKKT